VAAKRLSSAAHSADADASSSALVDVASAALGASVIEVSNQHYGHAANVISPFPPLNMVDGFDGAACPVTRSS